MNHQVLLTARPRGLPQAENFELVETAMPGPGEGEVLLRCLYLSLDPYLRGKMRGASAYADAIPLGGVMHGGGVCEVVESRAPAFQPGDLAVGYCGWQSHAVLPAGELRKVDPSLGPISTALGVLGMPGRTAYLGLLDIGRPKAGETVFVNAASGAVGATVGQIAKIKGCRVVGSAGGPAKVAYCLEELGFDAMIDHRAESDYSTALERCCPDGIDVFFENVGGPLSDAAVVRMNPFGRMAVCGSISNYNDTEAAQGPRREWAIITKRLRFEGFIVSDFSPERAKAAVKDLAAWVADGRVKYREDIIEGLENAPAAFNRLFTGENFGKLLIKVGEPSTA